MAKEELVCGFCGREVKGDDDAGFIVFPDGHKRPVHLTHAGVRDEYEKQMKK